jgi:hypothetical protein
MIYNVSETSSFVYHFKCIFIQLSHTQRTLQYFPYCFIKEQYAEVHAFSKVKAVQMSALYTASLYALVKKNTSIISKEQFCNTQNYLQNE